MFSVGIAISYWNVANMTAFECSPNVFNSNIGDQNVILREIYLKLREKYHVYNIIVSLTVITNVLAQSNK